MAFPVAAAHGRLQAKEAGGQPLAYGSIPENGVLQRSSGSNTHLITGSTTPSVTGIRLEYIDILNETTSTYTRWRCRNNGDGISELYIDEEGLS